MANQADQDTIFGGENQNPSQEGTDPNQGGQLPETPAGGERQDEPQTQRQEFQLPPELQDWVGEGKKYSDLQTALKSIPHAQQHIDSLEQQLQEYQSKVEQSKTLEDFVAEINSANGQNSDDPPNQSFKPEDVKRLVNEAIESKEQKARQETNVGKVREALVQQFGEKAKEEYVKRAEQYGMPVEHLNNLCASAPDAALALLGVNSGGAQRDTSAPSQSYRTEGIDQSKSVNKRSSVMGSASIRNDLESWRSIRKELEEKLGG